MRCFQHRAVCEIEQSEDDYQHDGYDYKQAVACALLVLVLSAPRDVVARGKLHLPHDGRLRFFDEATDIAPSHAQEHRAAKESVLAGDHRRPCDCANLSKLGERNGSALW